MPNKKEDFERGAIQEYNQSIQVNEYVKNNIAVDQKNPREGFNKIGVRYLLDSDIFDESSDFESYAIGLIRPIILGEIKFFTESILKHNKINTISKRIDELKPINIIELIDDNISDSMIVPVDILYGNWLKDVNWRQYIRYPTIGKDPVIINYSTMKEYNIFPISQKLEPEIEKKIIIYDKSQVEWRYVVKQSHRLWVNINDEGQEVDKKEVTLLTLNKMNINPNHTIKIIDLSD